MARQNCRLGWETTSCGFLSNYKGELDRNRVSFHPQPWCSLDEAAVSLDLASRSTCELRDGGQEFISKQFISSALLHPYLCYFLGNVCSGFGEMRKRIHKTLDYWINGDICAWEIDRQEDNMCVWLTASPQHIAFVKLLGLLTYY